MKQVNYLEEDLRYKMTEYCNNNIISAMILDNSLTNRYYGIVLETRLNEKVEHVAKVANLSNPNDRGELVLDKIIGIDFGSFLPGGIFSVERLSQKDKSVFKPSEFNKTAYQRYQNIKDYYDNFKNIRQDLELKELGELTRYAYENTIMALGNLYFHCNFTSEKLEKALKKAIIEAEQVSTMNTDDLGKNAQKLLGMYHKGFSANKIKNRKCEMDKVTRTIPLLRSDYREDYSKEDYEFLQDYERVNNPIVSQGMEEVKGFNYNNNVYKGYYKSQRDDEKLYCIVLGDFELKNNEDSQQCLHVLDLADLTTEVYLAKDQFITSQNLRVGSIIGADIELDENGKDYYNVTEYFDDSSIEQRLSNINNLHAVNNALYRNADDKRKAVCLELSGSIALATLQFGQDLRITSPDLKKIYDIYTLRLRNSYIINDDKINNPDIVIQNVKENVAHITKLLKYGNTQGWLIDKRINMPNQLSKLELTK